VSGQRIPRESKTSRCVPLWATRSSTLSLNLPYHYTWRQRRENGKILLPIDLHIINSDNKVVTLPKNWAWNKIFIFDRSTPLMGVIISDCDHCGWWPCPQLIQEERNLSSSCIAIAVLSATWSMVYTPMDLLVPRYFERYIFQAKTQADPKVPAMTKVMLMIASVLSAWFSMTTGKGVPSDMQPLYCVVVWLCHKGVEEGGMAAGHFMLTKSRSGR
jgi:hypothetical protein